MALYVFGGRALAPLRASGCLEVGAGFGVQGSGFRARGIGFGV